MVHSANMRLRCARSSRIRGTTVDRVANVLQHPILATCRPQDSLSAAARVGQHSEQRRAPAALLESRARGGGRLFERDRPSSRRLIGIESGVLNLHRLPIFSSPPESFHYVFIGRRSRSTTVSVSVRASPTVDGDSSAGGATRVAGWEAGAGATRNR